MFSASSTIWVLWGAAMVFFMQAGFAMVETGFTRAKNAGNIIMKNLMDFSIGTPAFWLLGFGIMFGGSGAFIGSWKGIASASNYGQNVCDGVPFFAFLIFQTVFCATAATIVSGAMAERTKFSSYLIYSAIISLVVYPVSGHWIWGGGWIAQMGFHDFAGSAAVHMVGGVAAFVGAAVLGPRIGKYHKDGRARALPGHSLTLGALGVFILWFCWFGFNGASTVCMDDGIAAMAASRVFVTTNLATACATVTTLIVTWIRYKKPDVSMTLNGSLAGLVAITAPCDCVTTPGAAIIGIVAGILVVFSIEFVDKVLKVDDPVGAVGVHGINGMWGTLAVGLFSAGLDGVEPGLFYGGGFHQLGVQALGMIATIAWVAVTMGIVFIVIKKTVGLRVSEEEEVLGLDVTEHNMASAYNDFIAAPERSVFLGDYGNKDTKKASETSTEKKATPEESVTVEYKSTPEPTVNGPKMTLISIICKQSKFDVLKYALNEIGVQGITMTQVLGCGVQKGATRLYRGAEMDVVLLPKVKVDVVVSSVPVQEVIDTAKKALYTGNIGDGKIFVYNVENVVKVRTGEEGFDALQGE